MDEEIWKLIAGFGRRYEVSDHERIRYLGKHIKFQATTVKGYKEVRIKFEGKKYLLKVHRLVATAFHGFHEGDVHHKDEIKTNNVPSNLEWIEHVEHAKKKCGFDHYKNKLQRGDDERIKELSRNGKKQKEIAVIFNIDSSVISRVLNNKIAYLNK
jgi:hypothetical protein